MKKAVLCAIVALSAAGVSTSMLGCGAAMGNTVAKYNKGTEPVTTVVAVDGIYELTYTFSGTPQVAVPLKKGDKIGFERVGNEIVAVAADKTYPINVNVASSAHWKGPKK